MLAVGVIEIIAGLLVAFKPRIGAYWLPFLCQSVAHSDFFTRYGLRLVARRSRAGALSRIQLLTFIAPGGHFAPIA